MAEDKNTPEIPTGIAFSDVITKAIQLPGVKVSRLDFLSEEFKNSDPELLNRILKEGPVAAGCSREELKKKAMRLIQKRTLTSSVLSFATGIPGGLAMAGTITADVIQFYGIALRMAQELSYLYGGEDLWTDEIPDNDAVIGQLILYCSVMLGVSGAAEAVRLTCGALAKQIAKKLPQKALTKTFYYPVIKSTAKALGIRMTKQTFAKGVSKAVPVIGGAVSGGMTFATMRPMGNRLAKILDKAYFSYPDEMIESDLDIISLAMKLVDESADSEAILTLVEKASQMHQNGILTDEEFSAFKAKFLSKL